jgi:RNase adaptor protein for sRNA GlmZ degradation
VSKKLTVQINSFSYKKGLPKDHSGNGGGFILDCRFLPNPGREEAYKTLTGNDKAVMDYFQQFSEMQWFIQHVVDMLRPVIANYQERGFTDLSVSFGCTGGQHRSVYCANVVYMFLKNEFDINVKLSHRELNMHSK